jgi:hypothetical protein
MSTRDKRIADDEKLIAGLRKHVGKTGTIAFAGEKFHVADLISLLQSRIDSATAIIPARAEWRLRVQADKRRRAETNRIVKALRRYLVAVHTGSLDVLADFGIETRAPRELTVDEKSERAAKAAATRKARHTMGKRKKGKVTGVPATHPAPNGAANGSPTHSATEP